MIPKRSFKHALYTKKTLDDFLEAVQIAIAALCTMLHQVKPAAFQLAYIWGTWPVYAQSSHT